MREFFFSSQQHFWLLIHQAPFKGPKLERGPNSHTIYFERKVLTRKGKFNATLCQWHLSHWLIESQGTWGLDCFLVFNSSWLWLLSTTWPNHKWLYFAHSLRGIYIFICYISKYWSIICVWMVHDGWCTLVTRRSPGKPEQSQSSACTSASASQSASARTKGEKLACASCSLPAACSLAHLSRPWFNLNLC